MKIVLSIHVKNWMLKPPNGLLSKDVFSNLLVAL